jgi:hypothetical protein
MSIFRSNSTASTLPGRSFALYVAIVAIYILTASGRIAGSDALAMFHVTRSLFTEASLSAGPCTPEPRSVHCVPGVDGKNYAGFGLVPSILAVPAYASGSHLASRLHCDPDLVAGFTISLFQVFVAALTPVIVACWLSQTGFSWRAAVGTSLAVAFGTPFWYYATKQFYSEPYFTLGLISSCYFLSISTGSIFMAFAGGAFGLACASRLNGAILFPSLCLYAWCTLRERGMGAGQILRSLLVFSLPLGIILGLIGWSNQARFGSPLKTGYHLAFPSVGLMLSNDPFNGMWELLMNGEVGLLVFTPFLLILPLLWPAFWRGYRSEGVLVLAASLTNYLFLAKYQFWHGGWSVGPRLMLITLPLLVLPLAAFLDRLPTVPNGRRRYVVWGLLGASLLVQLLTVPYPMSRYYILDGFYRERGDSIWWSGRPLLEAVSSLPELVTGSPLAATVGSGASATLAQAGRAHLLGFPNSINLTRADLWWVKAGALGTAGPLLFIIPIALIGIFTFACRICRLHYQPEDGLSSNHKFSAQASQE